MKTITTKISLSLCLCFPLWLAPKRLAATPSTVPKADGRPETSLELSPEEREQMAKFHEQMAACLRSSKSFQECHETLERSCQYMMGGHQGCPMFGHGMMHRQMRRP